jgi:hypothetical protein
MTAVLQVGPNQVLLRQGIALLELLSDRLYAEPLRGWAPVGAQYRHILEHYGSFLSGIGAGRVNYDERARDPELERSREAALKATRLCLAAIESLQGADDGTLAVHMDSGGGPELTDWRLSSTGRELQFLCSHTVHHFALIKLLLEGSMVLDTEFGMAPSTLAYQRAPVG